MAWPKGVPRKPPPEKHIAEKAAPTATEEKSPAAAVLIAPFDTCRYHRTEEPRIFTTGEIIPEGWEDTPDKFKE
jgi:hypothetical protein